MSSLGKWYGVPLAVVGLFVVIGAGGGQQPDPEAAARKARLFDDPQLFVQMSGAKRSALELQYGSRPVRGVAFTGEEFTDDVARQVSAALAPLANVLVNNPAADTTAQDTQSETAVVFDSSGTRLVAAFNDSGSHVGGASRFTGWSLSPNGGAAFTDKGTLPANPDGDSGDPVFARSDKTRTIFLSTLSFNTGHKLLIFRSTNGGTSFNMPVNGAPGFTPQTGEQDKQWIACDNSTAAGTGFGNVYMFWRNFAANGGMTFSRSTDDGLTWGPSGGLKLATGSVQGAHVTVGRDHAVYCFWHDSSVTPREIRMRKSTNQGASFGGVVTVAKLKATGVNGDLGLSPSFRTNSFPQVVANPANAKHLFAVFNDRTGSGGSLDRADIYLTRSGDGGATWSAPTKVNDDLTKNDQWQPSLAITPDGKRLCVAWYDRRLDASNNLIDRFAAIAKVNANGTLTFGPNFRVTTQAFPPVVGVDPVVNGLYMGDYDQMAATNSFFATTWGDNRDASTGHAGKNANVRFAKIPVTGPTGPGGGEVTTDEPSQEIAVADLPAFATDALTQAVTEAPADVVTGPVTWDKAFEMAETIAMYRVHGKDAAGRDIEAETKGLRVIEIEVKLPAAPAAVTSALSGMADGFSHESTTAVVVAGKVVGYTVIGRRTGATAATDAGPTKTEVQVTPEGKLLKGRRNFGG